MSGRLAHLSATLALVFAATAGHAQGSGENDVVIDQIGTDNRAVISQAGQRNLAGSDADPMRQEGIFNMLDITQVGQDNTIGLTAPGLFQYGLLNRSDLFNTITIIQDSNGNVIGSIHQESEGSVVNGVNALSITQQTGDRNRINSVNQTQEAGQAAQNAVIQQTGDDNTIDRIVQYSNDTGVEGPNRIDVNISGSNNGGLTLTGFALRPSLQDSSIVQEADATVDTSIHGNEIVMDILGNNNQFGLRQGGRMNVIGPLLINGDYNQIGLRQDGTSNTIWMAVILGDGNEIGIDQIVSNTATVDLIGMSDDNRVYAFQQGDNEFTARIEGNGNTLSSVQDYHAGSGYKNKALVEMLGDSNFADLEQFGTNLFELLITGDRNNAGGPLTGDAALGGLVAGYFSQTGLDNSMNIGATGDDNLIAASQNGTANAIIATIAGNRNQAAFVQVGANNFAFLEQNGNGNVAGIYQY